MVSIKDNKALTDLANKFKKKLPDNIVNIEVYNEIANFKDHETIYCIAYEMLIRTDEYNSLIEQYDNIINESNQIVDNERIATIDNLITQMDEIGLNNNSFLGFECGNGNVFEKIKLYDEISKSPWSVRTIDKFNFNTTGEFENILDQIILFYYEKKELYVIEDEKSTIKKYIKTNLHPRILFGLDDKIYFPCLDENQNQTIYKSVADTIYLKELDKKLLSMLKEKSTKSLLKQIKLDYKVTNSFWDKYTLNDIKYGINILITYYIKKDKIFLKDNQQVKSNFLDIKFNLSTYYIPSRADTSVLVQITKNIPLRILEEDFLSRLEFSDLKGGYIETEPILSRPKLHFEEARLINLPINLNLSKDELLLYIAQIKDEYDNGKDIVKDNLESLFGLPLESDRLEMPTNIKHVKEEAKTHKLIPSMRGLFKENIASAFYAYDLYKFFLPLDAINKTNEIVKKDNTLIKQISFLVDLNDKQVEYYLEAMKEFIHGVNKEGENNPFKKISNIEAKKSQCKNRIKDTNYERPEPKYKNLIIGDSYIIKSTTADRKNALFN